ncbi:transcription factor protein [Ciona intestinalis]
MMIGDKKRISMLEPEQDDGYADVDEKELRKKLRNRESAQRARDRQKARMQWLEHEVSLLQVRNLTLTRENNLLRNLLAIGAQKKEPCDVVTSCNDGVTSEAEDDRLTNETRTSPKRSHEEPEAMSKRSRYEVSEKQDHHELNGRRSLSDSEVEKPNLNGSALLTKTSAMLGQIINPLLCGRHSSFDIFNPRLQFNQPDDTTTGVDEETNPPPLIYPYLLPTFPLRSWPVKQ